MSSQRHLIVDGANVLHALPSLRAALKRNKSEARTQLTRMLMPIHDAGNRVTVVFDGRGDQLVIERPTESMALSVVFSPASMTADDVIEQMVGNAEDAAQCSVATDDQAERQTVTALGAEALYSHELAAWIERAEIRTSSAAKKLSEANARKWKTP
jgi:predicted RNA-binding protein with PIN domain